MKKCTISKSALRSTTFFLALGVGMSLSANAHAETTQVSMDQTGAQKTNSEIGLEFRLGPSVSSLSTQNIQTSAFNNQVGLAAGIGYDLRLLDMIALHPEIDFVQKGAAVNLVQATQGTTNANLTLNYLELPLLLKGTLNEATLRPSLLIGPYLATALSQTASATIATPSGNQTINTSNTVINLNNFDAGVQFGAGMNLPLGSGYSMLADFRYDLGLTNVSSNSNLNLQTRSMTLNLGFRL